MNPEKPFNIFSSKVIVIAVIILILILIPIFFFVVKSSQEKKLISNPPESIKPTLIPFPSKGNYVENQLIVEYKEGLSPSELIDNDKRENLASALQKIGVTSQNKLYESNEPTLKNFYVLTFKAGVDVKKARIEIYELPEIKSVEPNIIYKIHK